MRAFVVRVAILHGGHRAPVIVQGARAAAGFHVAAPLRDA
jgi:hypothetical protein